MNVLVVDDDVAIRTLVTRVFTRRGDKVESAVDGDAAIDCLKHNRFDLVVLDLMMPRIDGFAVLKYLSEHHPEMLGNVVVVTAFGSNMIEKIGSPAVRVIEKPFDLNVLLAEATSVANDEPK